jgi:flagellar protein FlgJ
MDVTEMGAAGLAGTAYLDNYRFSGDIDNRYNSRVNGTSGFEEALRKNAVSTSGIAVANEPIIIPQTSSSPIVDKESELYKQCLELETFLVKILVNSMRNSIQKSGLIDEGFAGKMYEDMLYDEYAKELTKNANFGMAEMAYLELTGQRTAPNR